MKRIVFNSHDVGYYVADRAQCAYNPDSDQTIGIVDGAYPPHAEVRGGVIYTNHTGSSCFMHVAGRDETWGTPELLTVAFTYPFGQLGYARVFGFMEAANRPALRFALRIGFKQLYILPGMFPSGDGVLLGMDRENCKWTRRRLRSAAFVSAMSV